MLQPMFIGGTNNFVFDSSSYQNTGVTGINPGTTYPQGTIQVFELPKQWSDGSPLLAATASFASYLYYSPPGVMYEVAFSRCPGDFEYYKNAPAQFFGQTFYPCGGISGPDFNRSWNIGLSTYYSCGIPSGETWYMNWRVSGNTCPLNNGYTCGSIFYVPRT